MAYDGIAVANIVYELKEKFTGGRIDKIYQPRNDEIIFSVRSVREGNFKVLLSANSMNPRIHITEIKKENPVTAPMFCMVLRKHIAGGRILDIRQPDFERIIIIDVESMNEMGDLGIKHIIAEFMGKYSNIILTDENGRILDSIKHVSHDKSSVREVLPGGKYEFPPSQNKTNPMNPDYEGFADKALKAPGQTLQALIYKNYTGISPAYASEICFKAGLDSSERAEQLDEAKTHRLYDSFSSDMAAVREGRFTPHIVYDKNDAVVDFFSLTSEQYSGMKKKPFDSFSALLEEFYSKKDNQYHVKQKAHDIRRVVLSNIERCSKKLDIQIKAIRDTENRDYYRLCGELITANIYSIAERADRFTALNYYEEDMPEMEIKLDPLLTASENANRYYAKYNKAKRTRAAASVQKKQTEEELSYLESVLSAIESAEDDSDINEIKSELAAEGYIKAKKQPKEKIRAAKKAKPMHFISSDGFDIYAGKSNTQNDELTLRFAAYDDIWLHTKNIPGSHVIIQCGGKEVPDRTLYEAAVIAATNSRAKDSSKVPVDYTARKNVKKPGGAKPGMVIYEKNRTIYADPDEALTERLEYRGQ
ncbi:MAG: NFACT RNA binding domain-containing protein [Clostridia bacterium]|nr:NFACT RNA binding domain-containing protein [Clostridia bacterium]